MPKLSFPATLLRSITPIAFACSLFAQTTPPTEPLLSPGPFPVGFRSTWLLDEGRTYRTEFDHGQTYGAEKAPRPVLVLLWYPAASSAQVAPMSHGQYFAVPAEDRRLASLATGLGAYARGVFAEETMDEPEAELDEREKAELATLLAAPTNCSRAAEPADGPFPLVVYHSGAGSSYEDNAALCEYLASHGYVVLGSPYPKADGSSFGIDAGRGSAEDVQFLVRWARALPFVDWHHVGLIGHSAGAQAMLRYAAQPGCPGDALVLLDTTQDYYALGMPLHEAVVREATEGIAFLTRPMLVAAGPEAIFALCDTLVNAERLYLTVPELGHDEYISQGLQRLARLDRQVAAGVDGAGAEAARGPSVRASYRQLCETVRSFLDASLRASTEARVLLERESTRPWTHEAPSLVRVARGVSLPAAYDVESDEPPTPRQFRRLFEDGEIDAACAVLERFREQKPRGPLYTSSMMAGSLLHGLVKAGRKEEAELYYSTLKEIALPVLGLFEFMADIGTMQGKTEQALYFLRLAHDLDPADAGIAGKLRKLEEQDAK